MKRMLGFLARMLLFAASLAVCVYLCLYVMGHFEPAPTVGYLQQDGAEGHLNLAQFQQEVAAQGLQFSAIEGSTDPAADAQQLLDEGAKILVVAQADLTDSRAIVQAAVAADATLFFLGACPADAVLSQSDNVWHLGNQTAQGAELLGKRIALGFRNGEIADANDDHILQVYCAAASSGFATVLNHYTLNECEHYGVYSSTLQYTDEAGTPLPFDAEALAGQAPPELIVCATEADARSAHATAKALGWLDGEAPVHITTTATTPETARALAEDGIALAVAYTDPNAATSALASFLPNVLQHQYIALGSDLVPDSLGRFSLPYQLTE